MFRTFLQDVFWDGQTICLFRYAMLFLNYQVPKSRGLRHLIFRTTFTDPGFATAIANYYVKSSAENNLF